MRFQLAAHDTPSAMRAAFTARSSVYRFFMALPAGFAYDFGRHSGWGLKNEYG